MRLELVKILGVNKPVSEVRVNGKAFSKYLYNIPDQVTPRFPSPRPDCLALDSGDLRAGLGHPGRRESKHSMDSR